MYSLSFGSFHEKVKEAENGETINLDKGSYKIKASNGDHKIRKVVMVERNMTVKFDIGEKNKSSSHLLTKKIVLNLLVVIIVAAIIAYLTGFSERLLGFMGF